MYLYVLPHCALTLPPVPQSRESWAAAVHKRIRVQLRRVVCGGYFIRPLTFAYIAFEYGFTALQLQLPQLCLTHRVRRSCLDLTASVPTHMHRSV